MAKLNMNIGLIGAGNMGEAMVGALIRSNIFNPSAVRVSDIYKDRLNELNRKYSVNIMTDNQQLYQVCDIIILAIKPQQMDQVLAQIAEQNSRQALSERKLIISIAAGVTLQRMENSIYAPLDETSRKNLPIIRTMPNTPAMVLAGMTGMSGNRYTVPQDIDIAKTILTSMGKVIEFSEKDLDAVTALSGTGPAYVFYLIESMIEAGVALGLEPDDASTLTLTTLTGALKLMAERNESPEVLRKKVTSPGGTTEAAFKVLKNSGVKQTFIEAITAASLRSKELSAVS